MNVHQALERVVQLLQAEAPGQIKFIRDYDPSLPEVEADLEQLIQALLNIVRNAQQALEKTPSPEIRLTSRIIRQFTIGTTRHRLVLRLDIADNGPGIPPDLFDRMYYPMISGRADGSGLGLSIAQSIVSQHGGLIECETKPGFDHFQHLSAFGAAAWQVQQRLGRRRRPLDSLGSGARTRTSRHDDDVIRQRRRDAAAPDARTDRT